MSIDTQSADQDVFPNGLVRRSLPITNWKPDIAERWLDYCRKCDEQSDPLLAGFNETASCAQSEQRSRLRAFIGPSSLKICENIAGRWMLYAQQHNLSVIPNKVTYVAWLSFEKERGMAPVTIATEAFRLWRFSIVVWPDIDWTWMAEIWQQLKKKARPAKDKQPRIRPIQDVESLGFKLMNEAVTEFESGKYRERAAVKYRDGLMLAMWAQKPLRLGNMTALEFGDFEAQHDGRLRLDIEESKNDDPDEAIFDEEIVAALEDWRHTFRPLLRPAPNCDAVFIGRLGTQMKPDGLYQACVYRTANAFGAPINPHLIRDCTARTIAEHSPEASHIIRTLLGHRDGASSKHYLGQAMQIGGAKSLDNIWEQYRVAAPPRRKKI
ncbi:MAG: tyrosine-type recombinase/integrase [Alphaproteobacteria bacterium]